jgi:hypothetical protein
VFKVPVVVAELPVKSGEPVEILLQTTDVRFTVSRYELR